MATDEGARDGAGAVAPVRCLVTAFEPFNGERLNPSREVLRHISASPRAAPQIHALELPVDRFKAIDSALTAIDDLRPDVVIALGEAGGRAAVTPERVAINIDDYEIPDNAANQPRSEPALEGGPVAYFSSLPIDAIVAALHSQSIPAGISNSAGTYLCNRLFYRIMAHIEARGLATRAGFVHLPYLHEQVAAKPAGTPSCSRATLCGAVDIVIATTCTQLFSTTQEE